MMLWMSILATLQLVRAVDPGADQQANNRNHQRKPTKPWCRKSAVLTAVNSLNGEEVDSVLLWGGKGDHKEPTGGSAYLSDLWKGSVLTSTSSDTSSSDPSSEGNKEATFGGWENVPQSMVSQAAPDARWKSSGDRMGDYFIAFGGDDDTSYLNDLWVLPLTSVFPQSEGASSSSSSSSTKTPLPSFTTPKNDDGSERNNDSEDGGVGDEEHDHAKGSAAAATATAPAAVWSQVELMSQPTASSDSYSSSSSDSALLFPHARRGHSLVAMPNSKALVLVGGRKEFDVCLRDTWVLPMPVGWPNLVAPPPPPPPTTTMTTRSRVHSGESSNSSSSSAASGDDENGVSSTGKSSQGGDSGGGGGSGGSGVGWGKVSWQRAATLPALCRWGHSASLVTDPTTSAEMVAVFGGRMEVNVRFEERNVD
jgi:hypothetical protein